jgi:glycosyltransferase involved in cell wall biosynthesis
VRIAFDEQAFQLQAFGGVSRYITRIAEELDRAGDDVKVFAPVHRNQYLRRSSVPQSVWLPASEFPPKTGRAIFAFNRFITARQIPAWRPDVVHETFYSVRQLRSRHIPTVITVHDMIHERFPQMFVDGGRGSREKAMAVSRADHVICVSESTRRDLCQMLDYPAEKTSVVHHGVDPPVLQGYAASPVAQRRPFLLYVGLRGGYKNFAGLLQAVARSPRLRDTFDVVAFGGPQLSAAEHEAAVEMGLAPEQLRYAGRGEQTLAELYQTAAAFVYPSLYEGFGMPLLEAMAHDCPVVSSRHGPCPEVCGDAAEYFDAESCDDISRSIEAVVFATARRDELVRRGRERVTLFTWQRCALATRLAYEQALTSGSQ